MSVGFSEDNLDTPVRFCCIKEDGPDLGICRCIICNAQFPVFPDLFTNRCNGLPEPAWRWIKNRKDDRDQGFFFQHPGFHGIPAPLVRIPGLMLLKPLSVFVSFSGPEPDQQPPDTLTLQ